MRTDWDDAIAFVLEQEGGLTDDPNDPGGVTKFGISKKAYPNLDIRNLTVAEAMDIYKRDYWAPCKCDELPREFAISLFDCAVNQGTQTAICIMQRALKVKDDGIIGPKTLAAAHAAQPRAMRLALAERLAAYARLMAAKPNLLVFAINWSFRVLSLAKRIGV
jgi:lysozyme family protein